MLIGAQLMGFAVIARLFGVREGLWPATAATDRMRRWLGIDRTVIAGAIMLAGGIFLAVAALAGWAGQDYGDMRVEALMRLAIPSVLLCALGVQALVTGFFAALLTDP